VGTLRFISTYKQKYRELGGIIVMKNVFKSVMAIFVMVVGMVFTHGQAPVVSDEGNAAVTNDGSVSSRILSPAEAVQAFGSSRSHARPLAEGDGITVKVYASVGPRKDAQEYAEFAGSFLLAAFNDVYPTGEPSKVKFLSLGRKFEPGNLMGGWTIWFATVMERSKPFMPTNLTSQISSSASDIFGKIELYNNPENVYGMTSRGQVTDQNGIKTLITGGRWSESLVTKFAFLGTANKTMNDPNQTTYDNNVRWMMGFPNFILDCKWAIKENGIIAGIGGITLETRPFVLDPPTLVITKSEGGRKLRIWSPDLPWGTSAEILRSPDWSVIGTVWGREMLVISSELPQEFFRLRVVQ
jgi:hypothetical protein